MKAEVIQAMRDYRAKLIKQRDRMEGAARLLHETSAPEEAYDVVRAEFERLADVVFHAGVAIAALHDVMPESGKYLPAPEDEMSIYDE